MKREMNDEKKHDIKQENEMQEGMNREMNQKMNEATSQETALISCHQIVKRMGQGPEQETILEGLSLDIHRGDFIAIMGPSGSGKSTLMYALSGMDGVDEGDVVFDQQHLAALKEEALADLRRNRMGFVFQQPTFLKNLNLLDNIILPAVREKKLPRIDIVTRAEALMASVGIADLGLRDITQVSGGQLQRAGICRALMNQPEVIFGDEPTGALNSASSREIMKILADINQQGTTVILVTHDAKVAAVTQRILFLNDGKVESEMHLPPFDEAALEDRVQQVTEKMVALGI